MEKKISFIHAADLHLDSPFKGLSDINDTLFQEVRKSTFKALDNLVKTAIRKEVDFVLLVGDLFDNEKQSLKAQISLRNAFEELQRHHIEVYLSYGNHDYIKGNIYPITYPENVHIFNDEQVHSLIFNKEDTPLAAIYGFSYENRAVTSKKVYEYKKIDRDIPFHIGTLHGSLESNTEHDTYAPFQLTELINKDFDYWALGHIHKREILKEHPFIIYPGNTQGRNRKETGEKGCYYVELSEGNHSVEFIALQAIEYNQMTVNISNCETIHQVEQAITEEIRNLNPMVPQLLDVTLQSKKTNIIAWKSDHLLEDIIEIINERFQTQNNWIHIFRTSIQETRTLEDSTLMGEHFIKELLDNVEEFPIQEHVSDLFHHKQARVYHDSLSIEEEEQIKQEAHQLIVHELLKE
ncbi:metallophosphoesterase family protein [Paucisalibacillus globulus]|uniref:metallophosphoesterase family protein n=1 Tax=Paucisalibacillus globulus TaxID=351095 RepID=UPI000BB93A2B|nr:DNA repair exonuclease [Paucisalibacillus globulus]